MTLNGFAVSTGLPCTLLAFAVLPMALFAAGSGHPAGQQSRPLGCCAVWASGSVSSPRWCIMTTDTKGAPRTCSSDSTLRAPEAWLVAEHNGNQGFGCRQ
jgi:hypothetical protein